MAAPGPGAGAIRSGSDGGQNIASGRLDAARLPTVVAAAGPTGPRSRPAVVRALARVSASRNRFLAEGAVAAPLVAWACACGLPLAGQAVAETAAVRRETRETAVRSPRSPRLLTPPPTLPVGLEQLQEARTSSGLPAASRPGEVRPEARLSCNRGTERQHALRNRPERSQAGPANLRRQRLADWPFGRPWGRPERSGTAFRPSGGHGRYRRRSLQPRRTHSEGPNSSDRRAAARTLASLGAAPGTGYPGARGTIRCRAGKRAGDGPPVACATVRDFRHRRDPLVPAERLGEGRLTSRSR